MSGAGRGRAATPRVCAIVTTYNYATYISEALDSVLSQTLVPGEIVVIDDGSTDGTADIVRQYEPQGVRYIRQENSGAGAARNRGLRETSAELVAFLDADDQWLPAKIERQVAYLDAHPHSVVVSGHKVWWDVRDGSKRVDVFREYPPSAQRRRICLENTVGNPSMALIRREALARSGPFDESLRWGQDWDLFVRLSAIGHIGVVPEPVVVYRWHEGGLSHQRRWTRLDVIHSISRRAISRHHPRWQRPFLRASAWSAVEYDRARMAMKERLPRRRQVWHATRAVVADPVRHGPAKAALLARVIAGESRYQWARRATRLRA